MPMILCMDSPEKSERRSSRRIVLSPERPVYLQAVHDGKELRMVVENLSMSGALLMCPVIYGSLHKGQCIPNAELVLSGMNIQRVNVIVWWQVWPRIGVQFHDLSADVALQIPELLETLKLKV